MKITLAEQIIEAEVHRRAIEMAAQTNPDFIKRLHRSEAICLTLAMLHANEPEFRQFMSELSIKNTTNEGANNG